jgi:SAM-dependent methyltransferase
MKVCPCCGGAFPQFLEFGVVPRPNALCPGCGSLERHRLLWLYLREKTRFFSDPLRVLHMAPEKILQQAFRHRENLRYISGDLYSQDSMVTLDIVKLPFRDGTFDVIFCCHVLEHILDDRAAMRELRRVLSHDGWAILQVPLDSAYERTFEDPSIVTPEERERHFGQRDHLRLYGRDYGNRLEEAGFRVVVDRFSSELGAETMERYCLLSEDIYFCRPIRDIRSRED